MTIAAAHAAHTSPVTGWLILAGLGVVAYFGIRAIRHRRGRG